ncbi:hypothetical protein QTQ03_22715 [Micromonospora sp. WMMA1363]|uniref:hypothetical protein n=1 Tax=Micromonospora sp. WMMA1363 TaxID=3053985 RepID=UPI00259C6DC6|nr:hypothetical protein [Micromonospora sp. WMMA1363]MDM4722262.1 hypothetical protein [Micromonospora sp. WMMA1363]
MPADGPATPHAGFSMPHHSAAGASPAVRDFPDRLDVWPALPDDPELRLPAGPATDPNQLRRLDREQAGD